MPRPTPLTCGAVRGLQSRKGLAAGQARERLLSRVAPHVSRQVLPPREPAVAHRTLVGVRSRRASRHDPGVAAGSCAAVPESRREKRNDELPFTCWTWTDIAVVAMSAILNWLRSTE